MPGQENESWECVKVLRWTTGMLLVLHRTAHNSAVHTLSCVFAFLCFEWTFSFWCKSHPGIKWVRCSVVPCVNPQAQESHVQVWWSCFERKVGEVQRRAAEAFWWLEKAAWGEKCKDAVILCLKNGISTKANATTSLGMGGGWLRSDEGEQNQRVTRKQASSGKYTP